MDAFGRVRISAAFNYLSTALNVWRTELIAQWGRLSIFLAAIALFGGIVEAQNKSTISSDVHIGALELSRAARPWEFLDGVGKHAGIFGNESGRFEAWVYPLKLFRNFDLVFILNDRRIPAASLVRTVTMRPEGPTLTFTSDSFDVKETWLVPPDENGAVIRFEISTWEPIAIEASFTRDFQLMWPAAIGGAFMSWSPELHAFTLGEESRKSAGVVGSPSAISADPEFFSNSYSRARSTFRLEKVDKGRAIQYVFIAGATNGPDEARKNYERLTSEPDAMEAATRKYYEQYLSHTLSLDLPDEKLQAAYDWSRISTIQGLVVNPYLGTGLVAGYRGSGESARPGFAWFFGRDSLWTDLALNSIGDFDTTRTALEFIAKYQRLDGKVEHEVSQTASLVNWWKGFPYGFASADATPLFIVAMNDYVTSSGDVAFAREHWDNAWRAYQFLKSSYDTNGIPQNFGIGHGWIEGGPLLPVKSEFYQSGLGAEAIRALATLARVTGKNDVIADLDQQFAQHQTQLNNLFWNPQEKYFGFAVDQQDRRVDVPTVLTTVPMWFGVTDAAKSDSTITQLADADHSTDWGMRIISTRDQRFDPSGYHFGTVWPLFTGWASVAEYRYHRPLPAYENLRANALLTLN